MSERQKTMSKKTTTSRTPLGKQLREIRQRIVASGRRLLGWDELGTDDGYITRRTTYYVPDDFATIQEAVRELPGGTIIVRPGHYEMVTYVPERMTDFRIIGQRC